MNDTYQRLDSAQEARIERLSLSIRLLYEHGFYIARHPDTALNGAHRDSSALEAACALAGLPSYAGTLAEFSISSLARSLLLIQPAGLKGDWKKKIVHPTVNDALDANDVASADVLTGAIRSLRKYGLYVAEHPDACGRLDGERERDAILAACMLVGVTATVENMAHHQIVQLGRALLQSASFVVL